ncbi:hypothetical protein GCM10007858_07710 [Bradyrhizobium liaoningense]|nr:hypothetical protein GCM10007858_07710 [Bradyrhizobium liaoningense]
MSDRSADKQPALFLPGDKCEKHRFARAQHGAKEKERKPRVLGEIVDLSLVAVPIIFVPAKQEFRDSFSTFEYVAGWALWLCLRY